MDRARYAHCATLLRWGLYLVRMCWFRFATIETDFVISSSLDIGSFFPPIFVAIWLMCRVKGGNGTHAEAMRAVWYRKDSDAGYIRDETVSRGKQARCIDLFKGKRRVLQ